MLARYSNNPDGHILSFKLLRLDRNVNYAFRTKIQLFIFCENVGVHQDETIFQNVTGLRFPQKSVKMSYIPAANFSSKDKW